MEDGLTCGFVYVDADVVSVGVESLVNLLLDILQHDIHGLTLMVGKVEVIGDMALGNDESVARRHRIAIIKCHAGCRLADDFNAT